MKTTLRRMTAMTLAMTMVISTLGIIPALGAKTDSQWQIKDNGGEYAYHIVSEDTTSKIADETVLVSQSVSNVETSGDASVEVFKTIESTSTENQFDIELKVVTTDDIDELAISPDAAVVLVMDSSGSMAFNVEGETIGESYGDRYNSYVAQGPSRIDLAKTAAMDFVEDFSQDANGSKRLVSLVSFNKNATTLQSWVDVADTTSGDANLDKINVGIESLIANEGTNIYAGLDAANDLLDEKALDDIKSVYVVLLSDGAPTYYTSSNGSVQGTGSSTTTTIISNTNTMAQTVRESASVYTLAFGVGSDTCYTSGSGWGASTVTINEWLSEDVASDESMHIDATDGDTLTLGFESIVERIAQLANAWQVIDPMGQFITLDAASIDGSNNYSVSGSTITWNLRNDIPTTKTVDGVQTYTYTLCYTITLETATPGFAEDTFYLTNGHTFLNYCFVDAVIDADGNLILGDQDPTAIIDFNVPAVEGVLPTYAYTVEHYLQTGVDEDGKYVYASSPEDTDGPEAATLWTELSSEDMADYVNEYSNYTFNAVAGDANGTTITQNNQVLKLYYLRNTTTATVNHYYYTTVKTDSGDADILDDVQSDFASVVYVDDTYTATANPGQNYTLTKSESVNYSHGTDPSITDQKGASTVDITLMAQKDYDGDGILDNSNNVINFYYYAQTIDNRSDVTIDVEHIYTTYGWALDNNGRYEEVILATETVTIPTTVQKYATSFIATKAETDNFSYEDVKSTGSSFDDETLTIASLTKDSTISMYYEYHPENPNELVDVTVNHIYETEKTFVDATGAIQTTITTDGTEVELFEGEYYVGETFEAYEIADYNGNDYTAYSVNPDMEITLGTDNNEITIKYQRSLDMLEETNVTVYHTYTLIREVVDEESGKAYEEITVSEPQLVTPSGEFYVGQYFTATTVNSYSGKNYAKTTATEALTIQLASGDNVVYIEYLLEEDLGDAQVTVTHTYYTYVTAYVDGAWTTTLESTASGEKEVHEGSHGERYTATPITEYDGEEYTRIDENSLTVKLDESFEQTIDLSYQRTYEAFTPTTVVVNHHFTTSSVYVNSAGDVSTATSTEEVLGEAVEVDSEGNQLFAGMNFTTQEQPELDGRSGFTASASNQVALVLSEDSEENVIDLYYTKHTTNLNDASVQVIHTYTTYNTVLVDGQPTVQESVTVVEETEITNKYAGQFFTATPVPNGFTQITEDGLSIQLVSGKNLIYIDYVQETDYTLGATLDVTHIYTAEYATGSTAIKTFQDEQVSSWATVTHTFNTDTYADLYEITDISSDNQSVDEDRFTIVLEEGENEITIEYYRFVDDRTPLDVTVNHIYTTYDLYTEIATNDGNETDTYSVYLEDETFTAELEEAFGEEVYAYESGEATIELQVEQANVINLYYLRTVDTTPEVEEEEEDDNGGGSSTNYYSLRVNWVDEDGNDLAEEDYTSRIRSGASYTTEQLDIDGYTFLEMHAESDDASGIIRSNKTVIYVYTANEVDVPEEDVPLDETPDETIPDGEIPDETIPEGETSDEEVPTVDVPNGDVPLSEVPALDIPESEIPMADIPNTGDSRNLTPWLLTAVLSAMGLAWLTKVELDEQKKKSRT